MTTGRRRFLGEGTLYTVRGPFGCLLLRLPRLMSTPAAVSKQVEEEVEEDDRKQQEGKPHDGDETEAVTAAPEEERTAAAASSVSAPILLLKASPSSTTNEGTDKSSKKRAEVAGDTHGTHQVRAPQEEGRRGGSGNGIDLKRCTAAAMDGVDGGAAASYSFDSPCRPKKKKKKAKARENTAGAATAEASSPPASPPPRAASSPSSPSSSPSSRRWDKLQQMLNQLERDVDKLVKSNDKVRRGIRELYSNDNGRRRQSKNGDNHHHHLRHREEEGEQRRGGGARRVGAAAAAPAQPEVIVIDDDDDDDESDDRSGSNKSNVGDAPPRGDEMPARADDDKEATADAASSLLSFLAGGGSGRRRRPSGPDSDNDGGAHRRRHSFTVIPAPLVALGAAPPRIVASIKPPPPPGGMTTTTAATGTVINSAGEITASTPSEKPAMLLQHQQQQDQESHLEHEESTHANAATNTNTSAASVTRTWLPPRSAPLASPFKSHFVQRLHWSAAGLGGSSSDGGDSSRSTGGVGGGSGGGTFSTAATSLFPSIPTTLTALGPSVRPHKPPPPQRESATAQAGSKPAREAASLPTDRTSGPGPGPDLGAFSSSAATTSFVECLQWTVSDLIVKVVTGEVSFTAPYTHEDATGSVASGMAETTPKLDRRKHNRRRNKARTVYRMALATATEELLDRLSELSQQYQEMLRVVSTGGDLMGNGNPSEAWAASVASDLPRHRHQIEVVADQMHRRLYDHVYGHCFANAWSRGRVKREKRKDWSDSRLGAMFDAYQDMRSCRNPTWLLDDGPAKMRINLTGTSSSSRRRRRDLLVGEGGDGTEMQRNDDENGVHVKGRHNDDDGDGGSTSSSGREGVDRDDESLDEGGSDMDEDESSR